MDQMTTTDGRVIAVRGAVLDVTFDGATLPPIEDALLIDARQRHPDHRRGAVAFGRDDSARHCLAVDGRIAARRRRCTPPADRSRCRSARRCSAACSTSPAPSATRASRSLPMCRADRSIAVRRRSQPRAVRRNLLDRHQGDRPADAAGARRQGRDVRRRRGRQDRAGHGADPCHGRALQGNLGVRRRRRALARRPRDAARYAQLGRARAHRARLWPDERAARRPLARAADRADHLGILPRRASPERAAADGQCLSLRPGRLGSVRPARPPAVAGRLSAHPRERGRCAAGAHRLGRRTYR